MLGQPSLANIPIAHLFGGETSYGSQDETIRHVLTKISTYHNSQITQKELYNGRK